MRRVPIGLIFIISAFLALVGLRQFNEQSARAGQAPPETALRDAIAVDPAPTDSSGHSFDGKRAMSYLVAICKIGPRISGTPGMKQQQEFIKKHLEACGAKVEFQRFIARQNSQKLPVEMANLIGSWHPERQRRVILCSHYDTRPAADMEADPHKRTLPFISANDGGSGVAILMEIAHHLSEIKTKVGIDVLLFDGEEYVFDLKSDKYFFGSEHFAHAYRRDRTMHAYVAAVLIDMIAGKNPQYPKEWYSAMKAGALLDDLWSIAAELKCGAFVDRRGPLVRDDHLALNEAGIPAVDIIDMTYPHWHRLSDVPDNCSVDGMEQVSRVLMVWVQRAK